MKTGSCFLAALTAAFLGTAAPHQAHALDIEKQGYASCTWSISASTATAT